MIKKLFTLLFLCILCIGSAWGGTAKLTNAQITAGTGSTSYGDCTATDGSGNVWTRLWLIRIRLSIRILKQKTLV